MSFDILPTLFADLGLLVSFAALHSALATAEGRSLLARICPTALLGTGYTLSSSLSLLMVVLCWKPLPGTLYHLTGKVGLVFEGLYGASWIFMAWAMADTGALRQCGLAQWWAAMRQRPLRPHNPQRGLYQVMRHPIYAAFLGMLWLTPRMTSGHLLVAVVWTAYIFAGAVWKERRLLRRAGDYEAYCRRVPPFPFFPKAPLEHLLRSRPSASA